MKRYPIMAALAALALCLGTLPLWSQMGSMVVMTGKVTAVDGKPVTGAEVQLVSKESGRKLTGKTDKKGEYSISGILIGVYDISVAQEGKNIYAAQNLSVSTQVSSAPCYAQNGACRFDVDLAKEAKRAGVKISPEEQKRREELEKQNAKIADLNSQFKLASDAEQAGDFDKAISILQATTQAAPDNAIPWANLAGAYLAAKRYPDAVEPLKKAIALKPTETRYHLALGDAYASSGKPDDAAAEFASAAQMDPTQAAMAYFKMGAAWTNAATRATDDATRKKDLSAANDAFDKAIATKPDFADAYYQKGVNLIGQATYTKDGKIVAPAGTTEAFQKYLELAPTGGHAEEAKQLLAGLGAQVQTTFRKGKGK